MSLKTMADELDLDLDTETESKAEKRIKDLSEKVRLTASERDEQSKLAKEATDQKAELQRERDFYAGFADIVSTQPAAKDYREPILSKVKSGYSVEDATFAVLGKEGKLNQIAPVRNVDNPAGGSAINQLPQSGSKPIKDMNKDEKRAALEESMQAN